jgi:hypothetical protein
MVLSASCDSIANKVNRSVVIEPCDSEGVAGGWEAHLQDNVGHMRGVCS